MKNPYLYGYLPLITVILFSLTFAINAVTATIEFANKIGVYAGIREFLSDLELRIFLLVIFAVLFFMLFSALKLIGETIHEMGMLFFSKNPDPQMVHAGRGGYIIFFFGALSTALGIQSFPILIILFLVTALIYFVFIIYKMSEFMSILGMISIIFFEIIIWISLLATILYAVLKIYNSLLATLPF